MCIFASFVDFPFFFRRVSSEGGLFPFLILIFALDANVSKCISESFGRSGYTDSFSRIGKDGVFIRRDCSFHLPRINLAKAGRRVTDTLSKKFMSVGVSTGYPTWKNFQFESPRMKLPSTAIFREGVKGKQRPFGLQLCASHGHTFAWYFRCGPTDGENAPHSPFASVSLCDVRDPRPISRVLRD